MAAKQSLFGLFDDFTIGWPSAAIREHTGNVIAGDEPDPAAWLAALNNSVQVTNVRGGARPDGVAVEAELSVGTGGFLGYPGGWPFVLVAMPDVEFRIQPFSGSGRTVRLFTALGQHGGPEVVLEGLPVEIRLPAGLVEVHPDEPGDPAGNATVKVGEFEAGRLDDLMVIYRRGDSTSILVHVRLTVTADLEFDVQPAVPVSFGRCGLSGIPCNAVHDFRLIPSPRFARDRQEWLRHGIEPWLPSHAASNDGLFAVRSVDVDERSGSVKDLVDWLNGHEEDPEPTAEFVLGDAVVPFRGPLLLPVPRHLTAGVRRNILDPGSKQEVYAFERAPIYLHIFKDPSWAVIVESFFYRSLPSETLGQDLGLTFRASIVRGADGTAQTAYELGLEEDYTLTVAYKRDFTTPPTGPPVPGPGPDPDLNRVVHWEIAQLVIVDVMAIRAGLSFGRMFGADRSFFDSTILTLDLFVSMPPTGKKDDKGFRLRALNGEKAAFALENVGWRLGGFHLEGVTLPDGVAAYFGPVGFVISELGLTAEDGASYLSFSGGLLIPKPAGLDGALTVKRLRLRVEGDESQPRIKIDGFFLRLQSSSILVEAGGYYSEREESGTSVSEFGFTGTVDFTVGVRHHRLGVDLVSGHRSSNTENFRYLMAQAIYAGQLGPIGGVELRGARLLYANNMLPKLRELDRESRELRYYSWYLATDPLTVPGDRRLAAWQATDDSWAFGVGASASFVALGRLVVLDLFVLGLHGPAERGLLVSARVFAMSNTQPIGFLAIEWDRQNDRVSAVLAVDATPDKFMKHAPAWLAGAGGLQGTLFLGNDPATLAIGRLADQATWLAMRFDVDLWLKASLSIAFCLEIVEGGPKGTALAVRIEGGIGKKGVVRLTYNAGWGIEVLIFTTGSSDYAAIVFIEAGIHFELFGFLRIGVSASMEFRVVGAHPSRGELTAEIRLETPWFLPDVTWRLDVQFGELAPADLSTASSPLAGVGTTEAGSQRRLPAHVERYDPAWDGVGVAPVHSVQELRAPARPEAQRLANLAADAALRPVATDATIAVEWSVPVNDRLGLGVGLAPDLGNQQSGDLTLTYDLVGIAVRRRARFGDDRSWKPLDELIELGLNFSDPGGVQLDGSFSPQVLNTTWDLDQQVAGQPAPKKLLLNGVAPYEFTNADARADEDLVRFARGWPCCRRPDEKALFDLYHRVHWRDMLAGIDLSRGSRFSSSTSTFRFVPAAWPHVAGYAGVASNTIVAAALMDGPGVIARAYLAEDAAFCSVRLAWPRGTRAILVMFNRTGKEVGRRDLGLGSAGFQDVLAGAQGPIRRFEVRLLWQDFAPLAASSQPGALIEVEEAAYVGLRDYVDLLLARAACGGGANGGYEGKGKLALLPNHEYELCFTTRVTVEHPSVAPESADVDEFVYVRTKGLPGLNAVQRTGEELEPYVREAYAGGRGGVVYREEPVTLAFSEGFLVAVPLTVRPPGTVQEHTTLLQMQLVVEPNVAATAATMFTTTSDDWVATHHGAGIPPRPSPGAAWTGVRSRAATATMAMVTADPLRHRLAAVTQRPGVVCGPGDPRHVIGTVLVAPPQGDGDLWSAGARFVARVRAAGGGFVDRRPFEAADDTAFSVTGTWTVSDGTLEADGAGVAVFGEPDWDHLTVIAGIAPGSGPAGVGFGVTAPGVAPRGLFVTVETGRLVIRRRDVDGGPLAELGAGDLPAGDPNAPIVLQATAYDDRVRAAVGEVVVEADRDEVREGRLCLVAGGPAAFASLQVRGLDLYAFPFAVSRFRSFGDHIGSWSGRLDAAAPDALGAGSTTATVGELWGSGAAEVVAAMAPGAPAAERERVFAAWIAALGLPLKDDVTALELTRVVAGDRTQALLIESPEPLDFTAEVTASLVRRNHVAALLPGHPVRPPVGPGPLPSGGLGRLGARPAGLFAALWRVIRPRRPLPGVDHTILRVDVLPGGLRLALHPALANAGELALAALDVDGTVKLFRGPVRPSVLPGQPALMVAQPDSATLGLPPGSELLAELGTATPVTVLLASRDLHDLLGRFHIQPAYVDVPVSVQVLQGGDARRALVIHTEDGLFGAGRHSLTLGLSRHRWPTTDPADDINAYERAAVVELDL